MALVDGLANRTTLGYDASSRLITMKNPLGFVWSTLYDSGNRVKAIQRPGTM